MPVFEGTFNSFKDCLERAVQKGIDLTGADCRNRNLANACLDDGIFEAADFTGANLAGANLSEARLGGATLKNTDLYNTCFAYADMQGCRFDDASFGGTDIAQANISGASFSTLSCFSLDFAHTEQMNGCRFIGESGEEFSFSRPPLVIRGLGAKIIVLSDHFCIHLNTLFTAGKNFRTGDFMQKTGISTG